MMAQKTARGYNSSLEKCLVSVANMSLLAVTGNGSLLRGPREEKERSKRSRRKREAAATPAGAVVSSLPARRTPRPVFLIWSIPKLPSLASATFPYVWLPYRLDVVHLSCRRNERASWERR